MAQNLLILPCCSAAIGQVAFDLVKYALHLRDFLCLGLVRGEELDQVLCSNACKWIVRIDEREVLLSMDLLCIAQISNQVVQLVDLGISPRHRRKRACSRKSSATDSWWLVPAAQKTLSIPRRSLRYGGGSPG